MVDYRFYLLSGGDLAWMSDARGCQSDAEAFLVAASIASEFVGVEAWQGSRLVCRVPAKGLYAAVA